MKRCLTVLLFLLLAAPTLAQQPAPNREKDVKDLVDKYRGLLNGDDDKGRVVTGLICNDLNRLDGGQWAMLIKNDRNPPFVPYDILVWKPTREHFDVLSGLNSEWIPDGPIRSTWDAVPCPAAVPDVPPPVVIPPPVTQPPLDLQAAILAEVKAARVDIAEFREDTSHKIADALKWLAQYVLPLLGGIAAGWQIGK